MAKLYFRYGAMGASKTANALMVKYNYEERGKKVLLVKPDKATRDGETVIKSRIGLSAEAVSFNEVKKVVDRYKETLNNLFSSVQEVAAQNEKGILDVDCIIIDEVQFLEVIDIYYIEYIVDKMDIPVICYGLRNDFQGQLFAASAQLFAFADVIEEIPTICWCGKKARFNARLENGKMIVHGSQYKEGGNESYIALCRKHFFMKALNAKDEEMAKKQHDRRVAEEILGELRKQEV